MGSAITILQLLLYCLLFAFHIKRTSCAMNDYCDVIDNQSEVDQQAQSYLEVQKTKEDETFESSGGTNICTIHENKQFTFCQDIFQTYIYGFEFELKASLELFCWKSGHYVNFASTSQKDRAKFDSLKCPPILYFDLMTETKTQLPYGYHISPGNSENSAILYVHSINRKNVHPILHPQLYFANIEFDNLKEAEQHEVEEIWFEKLDEDTEPRSVEEAVKEYVRAKQIISPYLKFMKLYLSINVCSFRQKHKVHFCRRSLKQHSADLELDLEGYNETVCQRMPVLSGGHPAGKLSFFRCPLSVLTNLSNQENWFTHYYLTSNLYSKSVTFFLRQNRKGYIPQHVSRMKNLSMEPILLDMRGERFLPHPSLVPTEIDEQRQELKRPVEDRLDSFKGIVRMPSTLAAIYERSHLRTLSKEKYAVIKEDRWLTDYCTISQSKIKKSTLIYQKFMKMYRTLDVCLMALKERENLCADVLLKFRVTYKTSTDKKDFNYPCYRHAITLSASEAENLETDTMAVWKCPPKQRNPGDELYFVGKSHIPDATIIYKAFPGPHDDPFAVVLYPLALATKIGRYNLAYVMNPFQFPPGISIYDD